MNMEPTVLEFVFEMGAAENHQDCLLECLPDDALLRILSNIQNASDIARCGMLNKQWRRLCLCVDRLRFVFNDHHSCAILPKGKRRCTQLGESMSAWLQRMKNEGRPAREIHCFLNCSLYEEAIQWLQPALDSLETLEIAHDMDWNHDICNCPCIWEKLFQCRKLQVLHMVCHYHVVSKSTLEDLVKQLTRLRVMYISVYLEPTDIKLMSSSLEDVYIHCTSCRVDQDKTLHLDMPKLKCLKLQGACVNLHNTPALQKLHLIRDRVYDNVKLTKSQSGQLENLKSLCLQGNWETIEQIKALLSVTSSVEELEANFYVMGESIPMEQITKSLPKLKKVTFNGSPIVEVNSAPD